MECIFKKRFLRKNTSFGCLFLTDILDRCVCFVCWFLRNKYSVIAYFLWYKKEEDNTCVLIMIIFWVKSLRASVAHVKYSECHKEYFSLFQLDDDNVALNNKHNPMQTDSLGRSLTYHSWSSSTATPASHPVIKFVSPLKWLQSKAIKSHCTTKADQDIL